MKAYRIGSSRHPLWDAQGSLIYGARWNSPGRGVIYAAESYSGSLLEILVHLGAIRVPPKYHYIEIDIPADLPVETLSPDPERMLHEAYTRSLGNEWFDSRRTPILRVPSVVTRIDYNLLINPRHPDFPKIHPSDEKPVWWDQRLFRGQA